MKGPFNVSVDWGTVTEPGFKPVKLNIRNINRNPNLHTKQIRELFRDNKDKILKAKKQELGLFDTWEVYIEGDCYVLGDTELIFL